MSQTTRSWNKLYLKWLEEWAESSSAKAGGGGSSGGPGITAAIRKQDAYLKAYRSLETCPKEFQHPSQLKELKFFGVKICAKLIDKLKIYCASQGIPIPEDPLKVTVQFNDENKEDGGDGGDDKANKRKKTKSTTTNKQWIPRYRSGGYAILLVLREHEKSQHFHGQGLGKSDIIRMAKARNYCDAPFEANPNAGSYYSAWNSVTTLLKHDLVYATSGRNSHYFMTDTGRIVANKLNQVNKESCGEPLSSDPIGPSTAGTVSEKLDPRTSQQSTAAVVPESSESFIAITWLADSYKIRLILDNREVKSSTNRDFFSEELAEKGVDVEVKALPVGDVLWVAESNETGQQVVLDYILERKRLDDLISSIKDGRFTEQKSRLHRTSLNHIIYLVEEPVGISAGPYQQHVLTAMSQSIVVDGFFLRRTTGPEDTVKYLASVTNHLNSHYAGHPLIVVYPHIQTFKKSVAKAREEHQQNLGSSDLRIGIDYDSFNVSLSKTGMLTIRDVFLKMLMTIRGVTWDKASAIQKVYPTPKHLYEAYESVTSESDKKNMIFEALKNNISRKKVGKILSERIYEIWGCPAESSST